LVHLDHVQRHSQQVPESPLSILQLVGGQIEDHHVPKPHQDVSGEDRRVEGGHGLVEVPFNLHPQAFEVVEHCCIVELYNAA